MAIFGTNLLPLRRGPTLMAAPRKPLALMGASTLPLAKTSHGKFRARRILQPSDSRRGAPAKCAKRRWCLLALELMSVKGSKADILALRRNVGLVPEADLPRATPAWTTTSERPARPTAHCRGRWTKTRPTGLRLTDQPLSFSDPLSVPLRTTRPSDFRICQRSQSSISLRT